MEEAKKFSEWCLIRGYKPSNPKALKEYNDYKRIELFKSKMGFYGDNSLDALAEYLRITRQTLSKKINGEAEFTQTEMALIKTRYKLTDAEFIQLFLKEINQNEHSRSSEEVK